MSTLFKSRKSKPRQVSISSQDLSDASVPYDRLAPAPRSPLPVGTVSQGLRGNSYISAPITNPTLTTNGTELNKFAMQKSRIDRERAYEQHASNNNRPSSPSTVSTSDSSTYYNDSLGSTAESSTLYNESVASSSATKLYTPQSSRIRRSEASSLSSPRSPSLADFGQYPLPNGHSNNASSSSATVRPPSGMTTRSESNRSSKYAPSFASSEGGSHLSHMSNFYHPHRQNNQHPDEFVFPRPETDEEIEALFDNVKRTRDLPDIPNLPIEQKWHMVYNDWQIRWKEEKSMAEQTRRQNETGQPAPIMHESPEWYVKKFLDKTITAKQAGSLLVSLRSKELRCVAYLLFHFVCI